MRWLTNFYDFRFKWTATAGIGIHPTKTWLSQLVNFKMQSEREDTLEKRYAITFCFKLGKNATESYEMLQTALRPSCMNRVSEIRVSSISTRTMHRSTTPSLSPTIWPRWASWQFLCLPIVQTLLLVTFAYSLSSEAVVIRRLKR